MKQNTFLCGYFLFAIIISGCGSTTQIPTPLPPPQTSISTTTPLPETEIVNNFPYLEPLTVDNINQLELITTWGEGKIQSADISPDEKFVALYKSTGVYIYDVQKKTSELLRPAYGLWHNQSNLLVFSPKEDILAIAQRNFIIIYDIAKKIDVGGISDPALAGYDIKEMAFSPDGKKLLVVSKQSDITVHCNLTGAVHIIALYDVESQKKLFVDHTCSAPTYKFLGDKLFTGYDNLNKEYKKLSINWETGETSPVLELPASELGIHEENGIWTIYSGDKLICKTNEKEYQTVWKISRQGNDVIFLSDNMFSVSIWTVANCQKTIEIDYPFPVSSEFRFDSGALIGINGNKIVSWNIQDGKLKLLVSLEKELHEGEYFFSRSENAIFILTNEATTKQTHIEKINLETGLLVNTLTIPTEGIEADPFISDDGSKIGIIRSYYNTLQVFNQNGIFVQQYVNTDGIYKIGFSPDGSKVAFLSGDVYNFHYTKESSQKIFLTILEVTTGKELSKVAVSSPPVIPLYNPTHSVYAIAPNWSSFTIAHNGENKELSVWDLEDLKLIFKTFGQSDFYNITYSPDSKILLVTHGVGKDSLFYFWNMENKSMLGVFMPLRGTYNNSRFQNVMFSPDRRLVVAQNNGVFYVWGVKAK